MGEQDKIQRHGRLVILGLLLASGSICWASNPHTGDYKIASLEPTRIAVAALGLTDCVSMLALSTTRVLAACRSAKSDTPTDYGLRLYILATDTSTPRVLSASHGLGDAYTVRLQKRTHASAAYKDLVLAEASAEYAYGTAVYHLLGDNLKYLGEIGYVSMNADSNPVSALDATVIRATREGFKISFTQDVFAVDKKGDYRRHDMRKAFMVFNGKTLH